MVAVVIVMLDEGGNLRFKVFREAVVFQEYAVFQSLVPTFDFTLGLWMAWAHHGAVSWSGLRANPLYRRATSHCQLTTSDRRFGSCPLTAEGSANSSYILLSRVQFQVIWLSQLSTGQPQRTIREIGLPHLVRACGLVLELVVCLDDDDRPAM